MPSETTVIHHDPKSGLVIALDKKKLWLYVDDRKWAFLHAGGLYAHRRSIEVFRREKGFYTPKVMLSYRITWEVPLSKGISTWTYDPKMRQRFLATDPLIFISLGRLIHLPEAEHVPKPRG
jgi:hypothetical protein